MATRKKKVKKINVEHIYSNSKIQNAKCCAECPLRIYANEDSVIVFGAGNISSNIMMILPSYDVEAKVGYDTMLTLLANAYKEITERNIFEDCYITRYIKCLNKTDFYFENVALYNCSSNLFYEIGRIVPKKIISFDRKCSHIINKYTKVIEVISPGVMWYDNEELKTKFKHQLFEALL